MFSMMGTSASYEFCFIPGPSAFDTLVGLSEFMARTIPTVGL